MNSDHEVTFEDLEAIAQQFADPSAARGADVACLLYSHYEPREFKEGLIDALTDIRHACDVLGLEFGKLDREAQEHYQNYIGVNGIAQSLRPSVEV